MDNDTLTRIMLEPNTRYEFTKRLGLAYGKDVRLLTMSCITHHHYCECECNGCTREKHPMETWAQYDLARTRQMKWLERHKTALETRITKRAAKLGLIVHFQGDPRGCTCKFSTQAEHTMDKWGDVDDSRYIGADVWNWR